MPKYQVVKSVWDHNGSFTMTVATPGPRTKATDKGARYAARNADPMDMILGTHIRNVTNQEHGILHYTISATRLTKANGG